MDDLATLGEILYTIGCDLLQRNTLMSTKIHHQNSFLLLNYIHLIELHMKA